MTSTQTNHQAMGKQFAGFCDMVKQTWDDHPYVFFDLHTLPSIGSRYYNLGQIKQRCDTDAWTEADRIQLRDWVQEVLDLKLRK